jgi:hypothetical protein
VFGLNKTELMLEGTLSLSVMLSPIITCELPIGCIILVITDHGIKKLWSCLYNLFSHCSSVKKKYPSVYKLLGIRSLGKKKSQ